MRINLRRAMVTSILLAMVAVRADTEVNGSDNPLDNPEVSCGCDVTLPEAVLVNKDDDNGNSSPDLGDSGPITGETDLCMGTLTATAAGADGTLTLEIKGNFAAIGGKIWKDAQKSEELTERTWTVFDGQYFEPIQFWIEGVTPSGGLDDVIFEAKIVCGEKEDTDTEETTSVDVELKSVSFSGNKYHELVNDWNDKTYSAPHWVDKDLNKVAESDGNDFGSPLTLEHNYSVAYTRKTKPKIASQFRVLPPTAGQLVKIRASSNRLVKFPERAIPNGNYPETLSDAPWEDDIAFYKRSDRDFLLEWKASTCPGSSISVVKSNHQIYLTKDDPSISAEDLKENRETLFYLACKPAVGKASVSESDLAKAIYSEFQDREVVRVDPVSGVPHTTGAKARPLQYYGSVDNIARVLSDTSVLAKGSSNCHRWANLFVSTLQVQGLSPTPISVSPNASTGRLNGPANYIGNVFYVQDYFFRLSSDATPTPVTKALGQGRITPSSDKFIVHRLVTFKNVVYDPSYGSIPFNNLAYWEDGSISGFKGTSKNWLNRDIDWYVRQKTGVFEL